MAVRTKYLVGVDLGGTNIGAGALAEDGSGDVVALRSEPTRADQGAESVVDRMVRMIDTVIAETIAQTGAKRDDVIGIGVGAPGPLDRERGIVVTTPNLGWTNPRHRHRRRGDGGWPDVPWMVGRGRRDRPCDDRHQRPPLQMWQLRMPRGLCVGSVDRRARARSPERRQ